MKKAIKTLKPYLFVAPALIVFIVFSIYPILNTIFLSFYEWDMISPTKEFVGIKNYPIQYLCVYAINGWIRCDFSYSLSFILKEGYTH